MVFVRVFAGFNSTRVLRTQCQLIHFRFDSFTRPRALSLSFFLVCNSVVVIFCSLVNRMFIHSFVLTLCIAAVWYVCDGIGYFDALFSGHVCWWCFSFRSKLLYRDSNMIHDLLLVLLAAIHFCLRRVMVDSLHVSIRQLGFFFFFFFLLCSVVHLVAIWHLEVVLLYAFLHFIRRIQAFTSAALRNG